MASKFCFNFNGKSKAIFEKEVHFLKGEFLLKKENEELLWLLTFFVSFYGEIKLKFKVEETLKMVEIFPTTLKEELDWPKLLWQEQSESIKHLAYYLRHKKDFNQLEKIFAIRVQKKEEEILAIEFTSASLRLFWEEYNSEKEIFEKISWELLGKEKKNSLSFSSKISECYDLETR